MVTVTINNKDYKVYSEWPDMVNREAIEVYKLISKAPEKLMELYKCKTDEEIEAVELDNEDLVKKFPKFYGECLSVCSDIPEGVIKKTLSGDRVAIYKQYLEPLVLGLMFLPRDVKAIESFTLENVTYELPKSKDALGEEKVGAYMQALEFTEAADLEYFARELDGGKYEYAANIISVLCRPKGEEYDEDTSLARVKMFNELPMDIVFGVFFSLISSMSISIRDTALSSLPRGSELKKRLQRLVSATSGGVVV